MRNLYLRGLLLSALALPTPALCASVNITPDGVTDAYTLFRNALGSNTVETPDCAHHDDFGPHIKQEVDSTIGDQTFAFHMHVTPDNDVCRTNTKQRIEVKVGDKSTEYLKIRNGDTVIYRWRFKINPGFKLSKAFTYFHQIKAFDGDNFVPLWVLHARSGASYSGEVANALNLVYGDSSGKQTGVASIAFSEVQGQWIEAYSKMTAGSNGRYSLTLTRLSDNAVLLSYANNNINLWRSNTTFLRPKWGIYRYLSDAGNLRDDKVNFANFCLAKAPDDCPPQQTQQVAAPSFSPPPGSYASAQSVIMSTNPSDATIRYTTGSTDPTCSSGTVYAGPVSVTSTTTLRAIGCKSALVASPVTVGTYTIGTTPSQFIIPGSAVTASAHDGNVPANTVDGSLSTRWSANGAGQWIQYDLQGLKTVSYVRIAWYRGNLRKATFKIEVSQDGASFAQVFSGQSSGTTTGRQAYNFTDVPNMRYVRITGFGNTEDNWNSITETQVFGLNP